MSDICQPAVRSNSTSIYGVTLVKHSKISFIAIGLGLAFAVRPVVAHHSFAAQYDSDKPVTLTGPVTRVEWMNPHMFFFVNIADEASNAVTEYAFEMGSPNTLIRLGWSRNSIGPGDIVTVEGSLARDGSPLANVRSVVLTATGKRMFAGSSEESNP
jgi:hypothetical protein